MSSKMFHVQKIQGKGQEQLDHYFIHKGSVYKYFYLDSSKFSQRVSPWCVYWTYRATVGHILPSSLCERHNNLPQ